ncbi:MAG TPA: ATP-dependent Clp protease adaptor ClpS [Labilithrix sp.]|jgi:ATP-dependent Clp protease adaptor protein ClpS
MNEDRDDDVDLEDEPISKRARKWCVIFWNDDYTHKWFVVEVLQRFFRMTETSAMALMMAIHSKGKGVAGTYTRDIAETKAAQVMDFAREYQMPLKVTAEPDTEGDED